MARGRGWFALVRALLLTVSISFLIVSGCTGGELQAPGPTGMAGTTSVGIDLTPPQQIDLGSGSLAVTCRTQCGVGECGPVANGCGGILTCGGCMSPETCGGGGVASHCGGSAACAPTTCQALGKTCGDQPDGCGGVLHCWPNGASACPNPAFQCVDGTCTDSSKCTKLNCSDYGAEPGKCGRVSDGCGGTLDCGYACAADEVCGISAPGQCAKPTCQPLDCERAVLGKPANFCGFVADGCGGELLGCINGCSNGQTCGAGGPDLCGAYTSACVPGTNADCGSSCGLIGDGCGGSVDCGGCLGAESCGGGGISGICGAPACVPLACGDWGATCGTISDGCGGTTASCGTCAGEEVCNANKCEKIQCVPKLANQVCVALCGQQSDGCGGVVDCGGCTAPNSCGGGGTPSVCGVPPCTPKTCADVGATCGAIGDGCGGIVASCGTCSDPDICGGGGVASVCGNAKANDPNCTGFCQNQAYCSGGQETRLSGKVYAPNGTEVLYNALVYVPNAPMPAIQAGASCGRCEDEALGSPLASALTGPDGSFVLRNVPAGVDFPLVVKMGKWRRVVTIPAVTKCTNVNLTTNDSRLPRHMADAAPENVQYLSIPRMAMVTGSVDELECVLRKMGVDDREFTLPTGGGRIHMYRANGAHYGCSAFKTDGSCKTFVSTPRSQLFAATTGNKHKIDDYDVAIFGCEGAANEHNTDDLILRNFANAGGRVFASHFSYTYLHDTPQFQDSATWGGPHNSNGAQTTGIVDTTSPKGQAFNAWLGNVGAQHPSYGSGYMSIDEPRSYVKAAGSASERFIHTDPAVRLQPGNVKINTGSSIQQYAFNTPYGASDANICGRVLYSGFHVAGASGNGSQVFPAQCATGPLTAQEKVLEFMIFDLSACVSSGAPPQPPTCTKTSCGVLGAQCGFVADGCGGVLDCGSCTSPSTCGGGGLANQCGSVCVPTSCGKVGANCGVIADGCGGTLTCGSCQSPAACGGGGVANVCGLPACQPRSCSSVGAACGIISDGCGGTLSCGTCANGTSCGGGGTPNVCGAGSCSPRSCMSAGAECGLVGDGCGGAIDCGNCASNAQCGLGGPNLCGLKCTPRTCNAAQATCGFIGDGCGGVLQCGSCVQPQICGGAGVANQCGGACTKTTCQASNAGCGQLSDGCGASLDCGSCPNGQTCGGGGVANQCGNGVCTATTCQAAGANCGIIGDGCGGVTNCGQCAGNQTCGGAGVPNHCGVGTTSCQPLTCLAQNATCGPVADGCGGLLDCGVCPNGQTCGGGGTPSRCGGTLR